ncbi:MAG: VPDSG-CTERM sorting domain-containing protein [Bryobacteraceae bacterium]
MKTLALAAIRCSLMFTAVTASLFSVRPAQAYTVTLAQMGSNVVANGSGPINLTGLTFLMQGIAGAVIKAANPAFILTGATVGVDIYEGITGPTSFGSGGIFFPTISSGDPVGIRISDMTLGVPHGYVSGAALSDSMTFNNATFASLGLDVGTYVWSWGTGLPNQNFTLIIGGVGVPDGGSTVSLLGCALLGLAALRRKLPSLRGRKS